MIELAQIAAPVERAIAVAVVTVCLSIVTLGFLQRGPRAVTTCCRSPLISFCLGVPVALVVITLTGIGVAIIDTGVGSFVGVLLVSFGTVVLPATTAIGLVSLGGLLAAPAGSERLSVSVLLGSLVAGLAATVVPVGLIVASIAIIVGTGGTVRVIIGSGSPISSDDRPVPPANQI